MPFLYPVYIARSDGVLSTIQGKARRKEDNGPTAEQLQKTRAEKGVYSWYQELQINDSKNLDWRRKLGGMLAKEMHTRAKDNGSKPGKSSSPACPTQELKCAAAPKKQDLAPNLQSIRKSMCLQRFPRTTDFLNTGELQI